MGSQMAFLALPDDGAILYGVAALFCLALVVRFSLEDSGTSYIGACLMTAAMAINLAYGAVWLVFDGVLFDLYQGLMLGIHLSLAALLLVGPRIERYFETDSVRQLGGVGDSLRRSVLDQEKARP